MWWAPFPLICGCCHRLKTLNLTGYVDITGYGLKTLCGSKSLDQIDTVQALLSSPRKTSLKEALLFRSLIVPLVLMVWQDQCMIMHKKMVLFQRRKPGVKLQSGPTNFQNTLYQGNLVGASCSKRSPICPIGCDCSFKVSAYLYTTPVVLGRA